MNEMQGRDAARRRRTVLEVPPRMSNGRRSTTSGEHQEIWLAATRYIQAHHAQSLAVDDIARVAITSRRQLQRVFATVGSTTVRRYLTEVRMRRAAKLLIASDAPLGEIARAVGYRHASPFIKAFRRHHGRTPDEWRRHHRTAPFGRNAPQTPPQVAKAGRGTFYGLSGACRPVPRMSF